MLQTLETNSTVAYVEVQRITEEDSLAFSKSGKAILFPRPKHTGDFWCPASLVRRIPEIGSLFADAIVVPAWFLMQNRVEY